MENASKALIIAGAVLISILLIGVGVAIFKGSSKSSESVGVVGNGINDTATNRADAIQRDLRELP